MTEAELLDRISSRELTRWFVLYQVEAEEDDERRHRAESDDGQLIIQGRDHGDDDGDDEP